MMAQVTAHTRPYATIRNILVVSKDRDNLEDKLE